MKPRIELSALDFVITSKGQSAYSSIQDSVILAQHVERLAYKRFMLAEHHGVVGLNSSATAILIGHIAGLTRSIRVGSAGVMLANHAPLIVAEQFGTLATLYPNRIDLGVGRSSGSEGSTTKALESDLERKKAQFPSRVDELRTFLKRDHFNLPQSAKAVPYAGYDVPLILLGSSIDSAFLAAQRGLPYAFAAHLAPTTLQAASLVYHSNFRASETDSEPYLLICLPVLMSEVSGSAERLLQSLRSCMLSMLRGEDCFMSTAEEAGGVKWTQDEEACIAESLSKAIVGNAVSARHKLSTIINKTSVKEIIAFTPAHELQDRLHSYACLAGCVSQGNDDGWNEG